MPWINSILIPFLLFFGTFGTGTVPLYYAIFSPSERGLSLMSDLGMGMLLGTAFVLVIPEGLERVDSGHFVGIDLLAGFLLTYLAESLVKQRKDIIRGQVYRFLGNGVLVALVVHGFADGLILGATINEMRTLLFLMLAVTIHRIPVVLSLVSVLVSRFRLARSEVTKQLMIFSLSSPCGYTLSAMCESIGMTDGLGDHLLLASGGSLLYAGFALRCSGSIADTTNKDIIARPISTSTPSPDAGREASDGFIVLEPSAPDSESMIERSNPLWVAGGSLLPVLISLLFG